MIFVTFSDKILKENGFLHLKSPREGKNLMLYSSRPSSLSSVDTNKIPGVALVPNNQRKARLVQLSDPTVNVVIGCLFVLSQSFVSIFMHYLYLCIYISIRIGVCQHVGSHHSRPALCQCSPSARAL